MALDPAEARGGAERAQADPAANHRAVAPALDVAGHVPQGPDEILDRVRRREEPAQPGRQAELEDRVTQLLLIVYAEDVQGTDVFMAYKFKVELSATLLGAGPSRGRRPQYHHPLT